MMYLEPYCPSTASGSCSICKCLAMRGLKGAGGMKSRSKGPQRRPQDLSAEASLGLCDTFLSVLCISCKGFIQISLQLKEKGGLLQ